MMELEISGIEKISFDEFVELNLQPTNIFGSYAFLALNSHKANEIVCFVNSEKSIGIAFGLRDGIYSAPWSAPYLSLNISDNCDDENIIKFGRRLGEFLKDKSCRLVFPPEIYNGCENLFLSGIRDTNYNQITDTSFYIPLARSAGEKSWNKSARRNLKKGVNEGLVASRTSDMSECYGLIARHHKSLGYNMAMTMEEVRETAKIVPVDFWVVSKDGETVAAMYCYRVRHDIVQVIASGDTPEGRKCGAAVFLERSMIDYYRSLLVDKEGIADAILDHGPTSVRGVQNEGLAAFKSSFGCILTPKLTLYND